MTDPLEAGKENSILEERLPNEPRITPSKPMKFVEVALLERFFCAGDPC